MKEFVTKYRETYPKAKVKVPGNVFYNGYMAIRELLRAVERAGSLNNIAIIEELEKIKLTAEDRLQHHGAWMNPNTHQIQQTIYMAKEKKNPKEKEDI